MVDLDLAARRVLRGIKEVMATPTKRDVQMRIGPSDLGDNCNYCLGSKMAGVKPARSFSMYPWLGSAIHRLIEWSTEPGRFQHRPGLNDMALELFLNDSARAELFIEEALFIPGYGWIPAHIDYFLPAEGILVDWKSSSMKKVRSYKVKNTVPIENVGQTLAYVAAVRALGYNVEGAVLVFIPRDSADLDSLWAYPVPWNPEEFQSIIDRAAAIYKWVEVGRWQELDKDPHCYTCYPGYTG